MKTETYVLRKSNATMFFAGISREMALVGPRKHFGGDVIFGRLESPKDIVWNYGHDMYPPKRFLLPHFEDIMRYRPGGSFAPEQVLSTPRLAIVGIRSCDVSAIRFQERFFCSDIVDPHFRARLDAVVLFSLVCSRPPKKECFCICCDSGPYLDSGFDVQLTDLGDRFLYEIGSEKGSAATEPGTYLLEPAEPSDIAERKRIELQADSLFQTEAYFAKALNFISAEEVPAEVWEELGSTCFRCAACTNLCPVCTCYTVDDRLEADGSYLRFRSWDSCQYSGFTREASGHNPRPTFGSRVRRRFYHKVSYQYVQRDGRHGCVGCGRCVSACLTRLDVPSVLKRLRRAAYEHLNTPSYPPEVEV